MWWFLVLLGLLIALAGLAVIALGISIFVSTFGNTLITTGAVAASGGFVIMAMGLVLRQLERLTNRLDITLGGVSSLPGTIAAERERDETSLPVSKPASPVSPSLDFPTAPRRDAEEEKGVAPSPEVKEAPAPELPRRREGSRAPMVESQNPPSLGTTPLPPPLRNEPALRAERDFQSERTPPVERSPVAERESSEERGSEPSPRMPRSMEPPPLRISGESSRDEQEEPRILKSGIVGGMAYTLYSDGSIQAELPDGIVRFDSLNELRDHVARTQGR